MSKRTKFSYDVKLKAAREYINGASSIELGKKYGCHYIQIVRWSNRLRTCGEDSLKDTHKTKSYTRDFKLMVVKEYLKGGIGLAPLAIKHKIPSDRQIRAWIKEYNGHEGNLKAYKPNGGITMSKGRKTTFEERIEIVEDCLKNGGDYSVTASKFKISYYQIYSWVDKYKNTGIASLKDNRGKGKDLEDMDKLEQLGAENRLLRAKLERLEMEVELKKKLEEVQMRLEFTTRNKN